MARILRGDVLWADLNPAQGREQAGVRPVAIISHEAFNQSSGTVIAMAITSQQPSVDFPFNKRIESLRMPKPSWVKISQIRTISVQRLGKRIGNLSPDEVGTLVEGLLEIVD